MRFIHLRAQAFSAKTEEFEVTSCLRAIGKAVNELSSAMSWLDSARMHLENIVADMKRYHEADTRERRRIAARLRKEYEDLKTALEYLKDDLADISKAFIEIDMKCKTGGKTAENASKAIMADVHYLYKLMDELEEAYRERDADKLFDLDYALSHRISYTLHNNLSNLALLINRVAAKIERGLARIIAPG